MSEEIVEPLCAVWYPECCEKLVMPSTELKRCYYS